MTLVWLTETSVYAITSTNPFVKNPYQGSTHVSSPNQNRPTIKNVPPQQNKHQRNNTWRGADGFFYPLNTIFFVPTNQVYQFNNSSDSSYVIQTPPQTTVPPSESYPDGRWVTVFNGQIPEGAIVYEKVNPPTYYCRATYNGKLYYGVLVPSNGCYTQENSVTMHFNEYEILVGR